MSRSLCSIAVVGGLSNEKRVRWVSVRDEKE